MIRHRLPHLAIFPLLAGLAVLFGGAGADLDANYTLSSSKIFSPWEKPIVQIESYRYSGQIHFRIYRIEDPVAFFENQRDIHTPDITSLRKTNVFKILDAAVGKLGRDLREAARLAMPRGARSTVTSVGGISSAAEGEERRADTLSGRVPKELEGFPVVREWNESVRPEESGWVYKNVPLDLSASGVYLVEGRSPSKIAYTAVVVSRYSVITKRAGARLVADVVERSGGRPVDGFPIRLYLDRNPIGSGKTDAGMFTATLPEPQLSEEDEEEADLGWDSNSGLLLMGYKEGEFVISDPYFSRYDYSSGGYTVLTYTERPIYRPGQEVYFKSIVRGKEEQNGLANMPRKPLVVAVTDPRGNTVFRDSALTNPYGTYSNHFLLGDEPPLGYYSIRLTVDRKEFYSDFQVEEYKKPEYKVDVAFDKETYSRGDVLQATISSRYFFGSPVAGAEVEYFVFRSRYWRPWWRGTEYEWYYEEDAGEMYTYRQEMIESQTGTLDADGKLAIKIYSDAAADADYVYRVQANVVDKSRRAISGSKSAEVTRGLFTLSLRNDRWIYKPGDRVGIGVIARDFKNNPVAAPLEIRVVRNWWDRSASVKDGATSYTYVNRKADVSTFTSKTPASGERTVFFTAPVSGYYDVTVTGVDQRGNRIAEESWVYVTDDSYDAYWGGESAEQIAIVPDKMSYAPGETMHALVTMPAAGLDALVSIECGDIYDLRNVHFDTPSKIIEVPIREAYVPNVFISVSTMYRDELLHQSKRILALAQEKFMRVELIPSKQVYRPGETGTLGVKVTDARGRPVSGAEVSLSVVDEAVYAIAPDRTPEMKRAFYGLRYNEVSTQASEFFNFYGYSRAMRREEMASDEELGRERGRNLAARAGAGKRIAYGDVKGQQFVEPVTRKDFRDMIHWSPAMYTDNAGMVRVTITYPDNLTTWRATARVITKDSRVGNAVNRVIARKDLLVRMETPRFIMQEDGCTIATVVHNYLPRDKKVRISLTGSNVRVEGAEQTLPIPKNGQARVDWKIRAAAPGPVKLVAKALTNEESDAMELTIPALPRGILTAQSRSFDTERETERQTLVISLPPDADASGAELTVQAAPSLASSILGALDDLIGYPYGCVEQTMSRFLPTVIVANALEKIGAPMSDAKKKEIPKMVAAGLKRLYAMQHNDGGWGWWTNDETHPFMTAYVIYGMTLARGAGYDVTPDSYGRGVRRLAELVDAPEADTTTRAYMLYVLSVAQKSGAAVDRGALAGKARAFNTARANNYALSLMALANNNLGNRSDALACVGRLTQAKKFENSLTYWSGLSWHYSWEQDKIETTAYAAKAILQVRGDGQDVKDAIRWLLAHRNGFSWESTRQTAVTLLTLTDYLQNGRELHPDYALRVSVNGREALKKHVSRADVASGDQRIRVSQAALRAGENRIEVEKQGKGSLYFTARILYRTTEKPIRSAEAGFSVRREFFRLVRQRSGEELVYVKKPFTGTVKSGEELFVKLTVSAASGYEYFMLEDPLPAGCEVVRQTEGYKIPGEEGYSGNSWDGWRWWWVNRDIRDEKVAFFARTIPPGQQEFSYILRAYIPGTYAVMPAVASLMYYPEVRGNSQETALRITE